MLDKMRKGAGTWVAKIFLGLLVLSFGVWGITDIFVTQEDYVVARVGDTEIQGYEFENIFRIRVSNFENQNNIKLRGNDETNKIIAKEVIDSLINNAILYLFAKDAGVNLSDNAIYKNITQYSQFQDSKGNFSKARFDQSLRNSGLNEQTFLKLERESETSRLVTVPILDTSENSNYFENEYKNLNIEKRDISYFTLNKNNIGKKLEPNNEQLKQFYNDNIEIFTDPDYRKVSLLDLSVSTISNNMDVPEDEVKLRYEEELANYQVEETRHIYQLISSDESVINEAHLKLASGADFKSLGENNDKINFVDLGTIVKNVLVDPNVADTAFELDEGNYSKPIKSALGNIIIKVFKINSSHTKEFDEVKGEIRDKIAETYAFDEIDGNFETVEDMLAAGDNIAEIAKNYNLPMVQVITDKNGYDKNGNIIPILAIRKELLSDIFRSDVDISEDAYETEDGGYIWFNLDEIIKSKPRDFETAYSDILKIWQTQAIDDELSTLSQYYIDAINKGVAMSDMANSLNSKVNDETITRNTELIFLTEEVKNKIFVSKNSEIFYGKSRIVNEAVIIKINKIYQDNDLLKENKQQFDQAIKHFNDSLQASINLALLDELRKKYNPVINEALYNRIVGITSLEDIEEAN